MKNARIVTARELGLTSTDGPAPAPRKLRWWILRLVELLARMGGRSGERKGLAVIRMDGIGDMVLFRRSLDHYAEIFGVERADITVIGSRTWAGLADKLFAGYKVHAIDEHRFHKKPGYRFEVARWLYGQNFRVVVLDSFFRKPLMGDSLMLIAEAEKVVTCVPWLSPKTKETFAYSLSRATTLVDTGEYPVHETIRHYRFLSAVAGREITPETVRLSWDGGPPPVPADGKPYVVLNFGSNEYGRRWPLEKYLDTARWLLDRDYRVVFSGAKNDIVHSAEIRAALDSGDVVDLIGKTSVPGLMDLLKHAAAVLTNDTGPAHLAIALGVPTLVLVGGGHFGSFVPYAEEVCPPSAHFLHVEMDCYHCFWGCHLRENERASFPCVAAITQESVQAVLGELLA
ncbi:MAG: glycosyltransferase family 9 protein [Rhodospirillales bacterium]|nr:glycosyltransferase family 9 protein [Rhodospirillales bacterium]